VSGVGLEVVGTRLGGGGAGQGCWWRGVGWEGRLFLRVCSAGDGQAGQVEGEDACWER
jgi:hypothetical protein